MTDDLAKIEARCRVGPCKCVCGYDAAGDLRVTEQDFTGRLIVTEDAGPDDHMFCPECDRELIPEEVVERTLTHG